MDETYRIHAGNPSQVRWHFKNHQFISLVQLLKDGILTYKLGKNTGKPMHYLVILQINKIVLDFAKLLITKI
jgi:hypothetical protein